VSNSHASRFECKYFTSLSEFELFANENAGDATVFEIKRSGSINSGSLKRGFFTYEVNFFNDSVLHRIEDFIRYENNSFRLPIILDEDGLCSPNNLFPPLNSMSGLRKYEPDVCVHSTSTENGIRILEEGTLKSQLKLINEGWLVNTQLGYTVNGEPKDYLNHINLGALASPWPERVSQSNQIQEIGNWSCPYQPGYRFYFDTKKLEYSGSLVRTGAPFIKVGDSLNLDEGNGYLGYVCSEELDGDSWLPDIYTTKANELFKQKINKTL
jgi:hypothetical protein